MARRGFLTGQGAQVAPGVHIKCREPAFAHPRNEQGLAVRREDGTSKTESTRGGGVTIAPCEPLLRQDMLNHETIGKVGKLGGISTGDIDDTERVVPPVRNSGPLVVRRNRHIFWDRSRRHYSHYVVCLGVDDGDGAWRGCTVVKIATIVGHPEVATVVAEGRLDRLSLKVIGIPRWRASVVLVAEDAVLPLEEGGFSRAKAMLYPTDARHSAWIIDDRLIALETVHIYA